MNEMRKLMETVKQLFEARSMTLRLKGDGPGGAEAGTRVTLTDYKVIGSAGDPELGNTMQVKVYHDSTEDVYDDSAFIKAAQQFTGIDGLMFTERGMQEDGVASMEAI